MFALEWKQTSWSHSDRGFREDAQFTSLLFPVRGTWNQNLWGRSNLLKMHDVFSGMESKPLGPQ